MRVLVLGAYGLIGQAVAGKLLTQGHEVIGLGRSITAARLSHPDIEWRRADIARLTTPELWRPLLEGADAVVNASGALQTGLRDDVAAVQSGAIKALFAACKAYGVKQVVQISAPGVRLDARTTFLRSKAEADEALSASGLDWVILRPAVVVGRAASGATALIRAMAAFPGILLLAEAGARMRTVSVEEVAAAAHDALAGAIAPGSDLVLAEPEAHSLAEVVAQFRRWLGLKPAQVVRLPAWLGRLIGGGADLSGWLGWRSPLRSTAFTVLASGGIADVASDHPCLSLAETLARMPATPQDRWFARMWLLKPLIYLLLAAFWIISGVVGFVRQDAAQAVLDGVVSPTIAYGAVLASSALNVGLGVAVLFRPLARAALIGMILVTLAYMEAAAIWTPDLWADPLGAMVKTLPILGLILVALAVLDER